MTEQKIPKLLLPLAGVLLIGVTIGFWAGRNASVQMPEASLPNSGGPEALSWMLADFKVGASPEKIAQISGSDARGSTLRGLQQAAESFGLKAAGARVSLEQLQESIGNHQGVIAFIDNNRFVWVRKIGPQGVFIKDGREEYKLIPVDDWCILWFKSSVHDPKLHPPTSSQGKGLCLIISPNRER